MLTVEPEAFTHAVDKQTDAALKENGHRSRATSTKPRFTLPLHVKLMVGVTALMGLVLLSIVLVVGHQMRQSILDEFLKSGIVLTRNLAAVNTNYVTTYNYLKIEQSLDFATKENNLLYATVLFFDGDAAAFSGKPEIRSQVLSGSLHDRAFKSRKLLVQYGTLAGKEFCEIAVPIFLKQEKWGTVRVGYSLDHMHLAIVKTKKMLIAMGSISVLLGCLAFFLISRRITMPIGKLVESVEAISNGEYDQVIQIDTRDEIGYLGNRFGAMQTTIKDQIDLLSEANSELEFSNEQLRSEITVREKVEKELRNRDITLKVVTDSSEQFLKEPEWQKCIPGVLARLGKAIDADCLAIFRDDPEENEDFIESVLFYWDAAGNTQPETRIADHCGSDGSALVYVPILVEDHTWGYLGFEGVSRTPNFRPVILDAIKTIAGNLGAAIQRKQTLDRISAANRAKDDFLANMSHELRTPLNHIIGFTELVSTKQIGLLNARQEEYLGYAIKSSKHLLGLINDILDLSKVEAGRMELELGSVAIKGLVTDCMNLVREKALKHNLSLKMDIAAAPDFIQADERKLKQILFNLLSNAIKFTPDNGTIHVEARTVECNVRRGLRKDDNHLRIIIDPADGGSPFAGTLRARCLQISVSDTGIGIKPSDLKRVFNRFDQIDSSYTRKYEGTGLGLSLAKSFVELHGGIITVDSEGEEKGSRFYFMIPI